MSGFLHNWLYALLGTSIICSVAMALTPAGKQRKVTALVCGVVIICALIAPFKKLDMTQYAKNLELYRARGDELTVKAGEINNELSRTIIEEQSGAYILDKAASFGIDVSAKVTASRSGDDGSFYPYEADISCENPEEGRKKLAGTIEAELGIPEARQHWSANDE